MTTQQPTKQVKQSPRPKYHSRLFFVAVLLLMTASVAAAEVRSGEVETGESRFAVLGDARVHYVNYGTGGEALIFIHGWSCNLDNWRDQIPVFVKLTRVIAIDLPGHGRSDKPPITYSMEHFARAVDAVMQDAKVDRAVLAGHSMGTPVARQFYRLHPKKTLALIVADGPLRPFADKPTLERMIAGAGGQNYVEFVDQVFYGMIGKLSVEGRERLRASIKNTPRHVLVSAMENMGDPAIWQEDKVNVPVLAIIAKHPFTPTNIEELSKQLVPNLDFHLWEDAGHFLMMEKPAEFNELVMQFLSRNELLVASGR